MPLPAAPARPLLCLALALALATSSCAAPPAGTGDAVASRDTDAPLPPAAASWGTGDPWNDGKAELSVLKGTVMRYGEPREAEVRMVTVAEDLDAATLVKSDRPDATETLRVLKLNIKRRFTTGVYDYDQMASIFLDAASLRLVKETVTHHELCGNAFALIEAPRPGAPARLRLFSYFDGYAEVEREDPRGAALTPEALPLALRGVPREEGWTAGLPLLPPLLTSRAGPAVRGEARVTVGGTESLATPLGAITARVVEVKRQAGTDRLWIEEAAPGRLIRWVTAEGMDVHLTWSDRIAYWNLNGPGDEAILASPPRTE